MVQNTIPETMKYLNIDIPHSIKKLDGCSMNTGTKGKRKDNENVIEMNEPTTSIITASE